VDEHNNSVVFNEIAIIHVVYLLECIEVSFLTFSLNIISTETFGSSKSGH
jgi:hypothetical protein